MAEWEGFEKLGRLGVGATGTVWLARQLSVGRAVALKELAPEIAGDVVVCERLRREAQLLARLDDPNCVAVYSFLESGTAAALVMEYVDGVSLSSLSAAGPLNIEQALAVLEGALSGLAHAHGRGIVHGDLKPENILLASNGQSKLVDFGLAAAVGTVRAPGIGSPTYSSPEAAAGGPLGVTSDLYSMALVLSELVAGTLLPGTDPATAAAAVPSPIAGLVRHALDPDPAARPQSAGDFLAILRSAAEEGYGSDWRRRAVLAPLGVAAAAGAASALGAAKAGTTTPGAAHTVAAVRTGSRAARIFHAHPLATVVTAATVVVAGVGVGLAADGGSSGPAASDLSGLPTTVRMPMEGLDWRGFVIRPSSCDFTGHEAADGLVDGAAGAHGSVVIPDAASRGEEVVGHLEAWVVDGSGRYIAHSQSWALPKSAGTYRFSLRMPVVHSIAPDRCIVQGVDPGAAYTTPPS